jgi:hypothetical protein
MDSKIQSPIDAFLNDCNLFFYGSNFWQAGLFQQVENLTTEQALWKPAEDRHCIWEYLRHINYWKEWAIVYIKDGVKMNAKESNWAPLPEITNDENWQAELEKTKLIQEHLVNVASSLGNKLYESTEENITFFRQVLLHDSYHSGQIGLMRALLGIKAVE